MVGVFNFMKAIFNFFFLLETSVFEVTSFPIVLKRTVISPVIRLTVAQVNPLPADQGGTAALFLQDISEGGSPDRGRSQGKVFKVIFVKLKTSIREGV